MNHRVLNHLISLSLAFFITSCASQHSQVQVRKSIPLKYPPILQIDTGGHKAIIRDAIFTKDGRYLVSASDDKTVRVWNVLTGETARIIRGLIGKGQEGKIFAAALSPDNRWLAVGGWFDDNDAYKPCCGNIRLIDFTTGRVKRLLKGHESVIQGLGFSRDSRLLISGSADETARIWNVSTGSTLHTLRGHTDYINAVAFSPDHEFAVTGSYDHTLKRWRISDGSLIHTMRGHEDKVQSVAFTPDGNYILSGSWDKSIRLWDGASGRFIKVLAQQNRGVVSLSISPNGKTVLSGNGSAGSGSYTNYVFSIPTGGRIAQFENHDNITLATAISPDGAIAATGGAGGEIYLWKVDSGILVKTFRGSGRQVWSVGFSKDGRSIAWGNSVKSNWTMNHYGLLEKSFIIHGDTGNFGAGPALLSDEGYVRAFETEGNIAIRTSNGKVHPTLQILKNGQVVHEITRDSTNGYSHRSLTITPDANTVISGGSNGFLTAYNAHTGKERRQFIGHTGDVWSVAVSPNGRYLVSGSADQSVRLWEVATGRPLITLFSGTNGEWVAWTPEGFYTSSSGGGGYVGYHINRGEDRAADYVTLDQIGTLFYRPDLVAKKVTGGFEKEMLAELKRIGNIDDILVSGMPPKITLLSKKELKTNKRDITFEFQVEDQGGGIGKIEYRINGALVETTGAARSAGLLTRRRSGVISHDLTLDDGKSVVTATVYNKRGEIASPPVEIVREVDDPLKEAPSLYVLAVGISTYRDAALKLSFAHSDADEMAKALKRRGKGLFRDIHLIPLLNDKATKNEIKKAFESLSETAKPSDVFVWYLGGHGKAINGDYHFVPWEAIYENEETLQAASLSSREISSHLEKIRALKVLLILDTCYAGLLASADSRTMFASLSRGIEEKSAIDRLMKFTGHTILAASTEQQKALEGHEGHGVFTYALLQGLKGMADRQGKGQGVIAVDELSDFAREEVPRITKEKWGFEQIPMRNMRGDPFPIGCKEGFDAPGCEKSTR